MRLLILPLRSIYLSVRCRCQRAVFLRFVAFLGESVGSSLRHPIRRDLSRRGREHVCSRGQRLDKQRKPRCLQVRLLWRKKFFKRVGNR
ncbi:uncharacterized protein LAESUDRAFT_574269 [Laetiporus sulphureus 93-53]|uniref:Uncharacterized protein n=1 Tax=Laetiporus sulphureus 93-53 TaxID=1314785 RepID=A0A165B247_9APHY|nr:uncharacterized protein LAESUDRAFT_574269 [Laetiporus sulphureus 93-53]KZT00086.1 hypothetical protein LAESUDRAFT_574269 [Laetiporus sulphureus 93-53]